jgi:hypothetical protein
MQLLQFDDASIDWSDFDYLVFQYLGLFRKRNEFNLGLIK